MKIAITLLGTRLNQKYLRTYVFTIQIVLNWTLNVQIVMLVQEVVNVQGEGIEDSGNGNESKKFH